MSRIHTNTWFLSRSTSTLKKFSKIYLWQNSWKCNFLDGAFKTRPEFGGLVLCCPQHLQFKIGNEGVKQPFIEWWQHIDLLYLHQRYWHCLMRLPTAKVAKCQIIYTRSKFSKQKTTPYHFQMAWLVFRWPNECSLSLPEQIAQTKSTQPKQTNQTNQGKGLKWKLKQECKF